MFVASIRADPPADKVAVFLDAECADCHDSDTRKGGLDLATLKYEPADAKNFATWVKIHDRVAAGEMPPKKRERPPARELETFTSSLAGMLTVADETRADHEGRATRRRLNRYEYENALRDLLSAPWLQVKAELPEDGEAFRFNKVGDALDISHVHLSHYLAAADSALRQVMAKQPGKPASATIRYYARDQRSFAGRMRTTGSGPERSTFPVLDFQAQPEVRAFRAPISVGSADPETREREAMGVTASSYEPIELKFTAFRAPVSGRYRLRVNAYSVWVGPGKPTPDKPERWWVADYDDISRGRRSEPVTIYAEIPPNQQRWLGRFDATPEPGPHEFDVWLLGGETIRPDAARLFRSRPFRERNPLAEKGGQPGVAFRWLEVEGPIQDEWPTAGHRLLFGDLPIRAADLPGAAVEIVSSDPATDAKRLLRRFVERAYRRPVGEAEATRFLPVIEGALKSGSTFADAMITGYTAVLCSPEFIYIEERPGRLDDYALASRLSFLLWNSEPDAELRALADKGRLNRPDVLRAQTERLLADPRMRRFVDAFLDYWLDLRKIGATAPDSTLYPDYYLDDLLIESATEETQLFFLELLRGNLPARNVVSSDFVMVNDRLATHYGLPPVEGTAVRRVALPSDSPRGGLLTQAAVLKVTANGTTTSPVLRGVWIMERILGQPTPPPPANVPAIEPDIRGATTIRQLLSQHRAQESCATCHDKIDSVGFALESFDVFGGWRDRYRASSPDVPPEPGFGHNGVKFQFHLALPVDASGEFSAGLKFHGIRDLKRLLLADEKRIARNLAQQLVVFATGAPIRFGDRAKIDRILSRAQASDYGVRTLVHEIVQSDLFRNK